jgi:O-antigen ligase
MTHTQTPTRRRDSARPFSALSLIPVLVWAAILILNGTYLRQRDAIAAVSMDWLVATRLLAAGLGVLMGAYLLAKKPHRLGTGSKLIIGYVLLAFASALFSDYFRVSAAYWFSFAGASLLTVGIASNLRSMREISRIETWYLVIVGACILKDAVISYTSPELHASHSGGSATRLGTGVVSPTTLACTSAIIFWMLFKIDGGRANLLVWALRFVYLAIMAMTRSRMAMIGCLAGAFAWAYMLSGASHPKGTAVRAAIGSLIPASALLILLLFAFEFGPLINAVTAFNRGDDINSVTSITGRTEIWPVVVDNIANSIRTATVGHGFGVSGALLHEVADKLRFIPHHSHNTLLEFLLTMGIPGGILFFLMVVYGFRWFRVFRESMPGEVIHKTAAVGVVIHIMILINSITETYIVRRVNLVQMVMVMYMALLGQTEVLKGKTSRRSTN